jgi:hypothetical protein
MDVATRENEKGGVMDKFGSFTSANEIEAVYLQYKTAGLNYVSQFAAPPISLSEWRERELRRLAAKQHCPECG